MSTTAVQTLATRTESASSARFAGLLRAELFKLAHLRIAQVLAALYVLVIAGGQLLLASGPSVGSTIQADPVSAFHTALEGDLSIVRMLVGIVILILTAHVIGLEYSQGTVRVLFGRGVGRLQLLAAKLLALAIMTIVFIVVGILIEIAGTWLIISTNAGSTHPWNALNGEFWTDAGVYALCVLVSAGVTLFLGVAVSSVGRSLAFGLSVGLSWFAVDNLLIIPLTILARFTQSHFWLKVSGFLLGPLLNRLPDYLAPAWHDVIRGPHGAVNVAHMEQGFGMNPPTPVDARHALAVIGVYAAIFVALSVTLTRSRDVLE